MLHSPPNPGFQDSVLTIARQFGFRSIDGSAGTIDAHILTVERSDALGAFRWLLVQDLPTGLAPRLITERAYKALRGGELKNPHLVYDGRAWELCDLWDGKRLVADLNAV